MAQALDLKKALVGALVVHAALLALTGSHRPARHDNAPPAPAGEVAEIDVEPAAAPAASASSAAARSTEATSALHGAEGPHAPPRVRAVPEDAAPRGPAETSPATTPDTSPEARDGWSFSALAAGDHASPAAADPRALGMRAGGGDAAMKRAVLGAIAGDARGPAPGEEAMASVQRGVDLRDREVGLGAGGPLVGVTRDAVRDGLTASVGHALLEVRTDGAGLVIGVRVLESNADRRAWDDVAAHLAESATKKRLRVPPGAKGVAVTLRVDSAMKTPSAHDAGETSVSVFGVPVKKSRAAHPVHVDLSIPLVSGNINPTDALLDATSHPVRVVSVWVEDERRL